MTEGTEKQRVTFVITFDDDRTMIAQIDEIAQRARVSRSDIIRSALRFFVAHSPVNETVPFEIVPAQSATRIDA